MSSGNKPNDAARNANNFRMPRVQQQDQMVEVAGEKLFLKPLAQLLGCPPEQVRFVVMPTLEHKLVLLTMGIKGRKDLYAFPLSADFARSLGELLVNGARQIRIADDAEANPPEPVKG